MLVASYNRNGLVKKPSAVIALGFIIVYCPALYQKPKISSRNPSGPSLRFGILNSFSHSFTPLGSSNIFKSCFRSLMPARNDLMSALTGKITEEELLKYFEEGKTLKFDHVVEIALKSGKN